MKALRRFATGCARCRRKRKSGESRWLFPRASIFCLTAWCSPKAMEGRPCPRVSCGARKSQAKSVDLEFKRRDVEHLLFHRERAELVTRFLAFVDSL